MMRSAPEARDPSPPNRYLPDEGTERMGDDFLRESLEVGEALREAGLGRRWPDDPDMEALGLWLAEGCLTPEAAITSESLRE